MAFNAQEQALDRAQKMFGKSAYAVEGVDYKKVGFLRNGKHIFSTGDTWEVAIEELERKAKP
jgi:hypothetical protein